MFYSPLLGKASNFAVFKWQSPVNFFISLFYVINMIVSGKNSISAWF